MVDTVKISALPAVVTPAGTDTFPVVQGGVTKKETVAQALTGAGGVVGPASATDNAVTRFDGTTGKLVQNSNATIDDSGNLTANNLSGSSSGTNTGDVTLSAFGSTPNADGASLSGQTLTLQPANAINPGGVSVNPQQFSGQKVFLNTLAIRDSSAALDVAMAMTSSPALTQSRTLTTDMNDGSRTISYAGDLIVVADATVSGTNTGDVTVTDTSNIDLSLTGQQISADLTTTGVTANSYSLSNITVDNKGRVSAASNSFLIAGTGISIDESTPGEYVFSVLEGGFDWRPVNTPGAKILAAGEGLISDTIATTDYQFDSTPGAYPVGCAFGVAGGEAPGWTITVPSGVTIKIANITYTGPTTISSNSINDVLVFLCIKADTLFFGWNSNNAAFVGSGRTATNYTPTDNSIKGNLDGIDSALGDITNSIFNWENKTVAGTYTLANKIGYIANTAGTFSASLPAICAVGEMYAISIGTSNDNSLIIHPGQTVNFGGNSLNNGAMIDLGMLLQGSHDVLFIVCTAANTTFSIFASSSAQYIDSNYSPANYTPTSNNLDGSLEGIDNTLTNIATIYRDVYVDVGRGIDGVGGNGSQLYPYKTPAFAMSQITPSSTVRYNINILSGVYDGADGTFAIKPFTSITCEDALSTRFTNSSITLDSSWLNTDSEISITNLNTISGTGINFVTTTFGTATVKIYFIDFYSSTTFNYLGRNSGKDTIFFIPKDVSGNITVDSCLLFCFSGFITGAISSFATTGISQIIFDGTITTGPVTVQSTTFAATLSLASGVGVGLMTVDGSQAFLNLSAGMALFSGYSAINGATVTPITPASSIIAGFTPSYYTPVDTSVKGHLEGIDNALGTLVPSTPFTWVTLTGSPGTTTLVDGTGYIDNTDSGAQFILPVTSTIQFRSAIQGGTSPGWSLANNSGQNMQAGKINSGIGEGSTIASTDPSDRIEIGCDLANLNFVIYNIQGNPEIISSLAPSDFSGLGLLGYWDANQVNSGSPPNDGDPIPTWVDLSPAANDFVQGGGGDQPIYKELIQNGLSGVLFDGISQYMTNATFANNTDKLYIFLVSRIVTAANVCQGFISAYKAGSNDDWNETQNLATSNCSPQIQTTRPFQGINFDQPAFNVSFIWGIGFDGTKQYGQVTQQPMQTISATGNFDQDRLVIGARYSSGSINTFANEYHHQIIIGNGILTPFQIKGFCSALANIWGIPE